MRAGTLDTRCRIEYKSVTQDPDYGTEVITWLLLAVVWCTIADVPPSRSESVKQGLVLARNQSIVTMRYRSDIDSTMRLVILRPTPVTYQIVGGPAEVEKQVSIELVVEKYSS